MKRRTLVTLLASCLTARAFAGSGDAPGSYAVLSLVGDEVTVVTYQMSTGSHLDRNLRTSMAVPDEVFDKAALLAAESALKKFDPGAQVQLLAASTPSLFTHQEDLFSGNRLVLPPRLAAAVQGSGATRLLLLTKHRAEAKMQLRSSKIGSGSVEGLGFYVDRDTHTIEHETRIGAQGFLAPFVFVKFSLVNLADFGVIRQKAVTASRTVTAGRAEESLDAWDALTPEQKFAALTDLLSREITNAVPTLVATP